MVQLLATSPNMCRNIREGILLGDLAFKTRVNEAQIRERYQALRSRQQNRNTTEAGHETMSHEAARLLNGHPTRDDRMESEIIEILFAAPGHAELVRAEVPVASIGNTCLARVLQTCYRLMDEELSPSFDRVMSRLEDGELKRLAVWIDEQSRSKNMRDKLREDVAESENGCPLLLRRSLDLLKWRREEQSHGPTTDDLSVRPDGAHQMDAATESKLRRSFEFHQRRATKRAEV